MPPFLQGKARLLLPLASDSHLATYNNPLFSHHKKATKQMVFSSKAILAEEEGGRHETEKAWNPSWDCSTSTSSTSLRLSCVIKKHDQWLKWAADGFDRDVRHHHLILPCALEKRWDGRTMATSSKIILQTLKAWVIGFDFDCSIKSQAAPVPENDFLTWVAVNLSPSWRRPALYHSPQSKGLFEWCFDLQASYAAEPKLSLQCNTD